MANADLEPGGGTGPLLDAVVTAGAPAAALDRAPTPFPLLIKQLLVTPIARAVRSEIVCAGGVRYDYRTLLERIARLGNVLATMGLRQGDTVAVMDWDSHRYLECYFAIPMSGCVMQAVNVRLSPEQIAYTLKHARARVILVHADFVPLLDAIDASLAMRPLRILLDDDRSTRQCATGFVGEYETLMAEAASSCKFPDLDENTRATTFYTSGTTGLPKGVFYSHRQIVLHTLGVAASFGTAASQGRLHVEDVYMPITPLFHAHAWGMPYVATLLGIKQVYAGRYQPDALLDLIEGEQVTFSHCVATLLQMLLEHPRSSQVDLSRLKVLVGGGPLPQGLAHAALQRGIDVFTGYGMSETGPIQVINHLRASEAQHNIDTQVGLRTRAGQPIMLCDVQVVDSEMNILPKDGRHTGEIVFRGPWLTSGYHDNAEGSEALWRGGWLHSGDIGLFQADGSLRITDRLKDVIKSGGEWISSQELESLISRHPGVSETAVIAVADEKWGERPLALIVPTEQARAWLCAESIRDHLLALAADGAIAKYAVPEQYVFVESLHKTSVGKLDKKALRQQYAR